MPPSPSEYTCIEAFHALQRSSDAGMAEAWFESFPIVMLGNPSQAFLWFAVVHLNTLIKLRRNLPDTHPSRWAYVDCALQLIRQSSALISQKAHALATSNAMVSHSDTI